MRRTFLLLTASALVALPAAIADARPPVNCDPAACPTPTACVESLAINSDPASGGPIVSCRLR